MRIFSILSLVIVLSASCNQSDTKIPGNQLAKGKHENESPARESKNQVTPGTYLCWQNNQASISGRDLLGEITISGNSYTGDMHGNGKYTFDPSTKMVRFDGGGFDQRKNGKEWIGIFYQKGEKFIDGSGGSAANTMLIITSLEDWNKGYKKAWIQQCDLK